MTTNKLLLGQIIIVFAIRVETKMNCKLLGQRLMDWDFDRRVTEIQIRIAAFNRYTTLGIQTIKPVA